MADITFTDAALDDLRRIGPEIVPRVLKKLLILVDDPAAGYPLGGALTGYRKLVVGRNTWRIVYRLTDDKSVEICEVWAIGARADAEVYAEAISRIAAAGQDRPEFRHLRQVIEDLGKFAGDVVGPDVPRRDPVPDWLAKRLIHTAGLLPEQVAALSLEQAVDTWAEFTSRPRPADPPGSGETR
jgi:mRNA interferase RelE/StbE